jgi:hypothetical protein
MRACSGRDLSSGVIPGPTEAGPGIHQEASDALIAFVAIALSLLLAAIVAFGRGANRCAVRPRRSD